MRRLLIAATAILTTMSTAHADTTSLIAHLRQTYSYPLHTELFEQCGVIIKPGMQARYDATYNHITAKADADITAALALLGMSIHEYPSRLMSRLITETAVTDEVDVCDVVIRNNDRP